MKTKIILLAFFLLACVRIKPTGTFHQMASFYGIDTRLGVSYKF